MQSNLYPKGPLNIPSNLTLPSKEYKKKVWIASMTILLFLLSYLGLGGWFIYKSYRFFKNSFNGGNDPVITFICAVLMGFLGVFMLKALFFIIKRDKSESIEIKEIDEPKLFEFIYRVADDAKAPRPHKVFLSNTVNACVFYDISILNLFFPTRKNLEIGLGLVNTLNLGEFKSILAHEFGHFTQKSMIIGRWVYIAHQIVHQIVAKRDMFDRMLNGLSSFDLRVAWIGWIMSIIVWSIRAVSEIFFKLVLITERALSREMEFHADLVAVSLTGSDELIHSLYKLTPADMAFAGALEFVNKQLTKNKSVSDIYAIQENIIKNMAIVLNNPSYGLSPKFEDKDGSKFKVFKEQIAQAPKMWSTHPSNIDREKNAKAIYIKSEVDERSSWILFEDPDKTKNIGTRSLYKNIEIETSPLSKEESLELHNKEFEKTYLSPKYRGVYLNVSTLLRFQSLKELYDLEINYQEITTIFSSLYPEILQHQLSQLKDLEEEIFMLEGINNKELDANEGKINYRNQEINRKELPGIIEETKKEAKQIRDQIDEHLKVCRNAHYVAAKQCGNGWPEYLYSLVKLIHYCEHSIKNIENLSNYFFETLVIVSKIRNINDAKIAPLLNAANNLQAELSNLFNNCAAVKLCPALVEKLDGKQNSELFEPFKLGEADRSNINSWIEVSGSWVNLGLQNLQTLREAVLDELLKTEEYIEKIHDSLTENGTSAPIAIETPNYAIVNSTEKKKVNQELDFFSKFYHSTGFGPTIGRLAVAASIIIGAILFSSGIGKTNIIAYNALPIDVLVEIDGDTYKIPANYFKELSIDHSERIQISTTSTDGEKIESFSQQLNTNSKTYVYNIAHSAIIYSYSIYYTSSVDDSFPPETPELLGTKRWFETDADYNFVDPPESIQLSKGSAFEYRKALVVHRGHPSQLVGSIMNEKELNDFVKIHAYWEKSNSPHLLTWLNLASNLKDFPKVLEKRLSRNNLEIASLRMQQEIYKNSNNTKICETHHKLFQKNPANPDFYYLSVRCQEDGPEQDKAFIKGHNKWPTNPWLAFASSYCFVEKKEWNKALKGYKIITSKAPYLVEAISTELKRVSHLLHEDTVMRRLDINEFPYLNYVNMIEQSKGESFVENENPDNFFYAYKLLEKGKIQEALDYCEKDTITYNAVLSLAAVSDGAGVDIKERAIQLISYKEKNVETIMCDLALLIQHKKSIEGYREFLKTMTYENSEAIYQFITFVKENKIAEADKLQNEMTAEMRGKTSLLGVLLLGKKAPYNWNLYASTLLFINEKPYRFDEIKEWSVGGLK